MVGNRPKPTNGFGSYDWPVVELFEGVSHLVATAGQGCRFQESGTRARGRGGGFSRSFDRRHAFPGGLHSQGPDTAGTRRRTLKPGAVVSCAHSRAKPASWCSRWRSQARIHPEASSWECRLESRLVRLLCEAARLGFWCSLSTQTGWAELAHLTCREPDVHSSRKVFAAVIFRFPLWNPCAQTLLCAVTPRVCHR